MEAQVQLEEVQQFTIHCDSLSARHAQFTVFANGAYCGQLVMNVDEWRAFCAALRAGAMGVPIAVEFSGELLNEFAKLVPKTLDNADEIGYDSSDAREGVNG